jgi:hypothetical protein
MHTIGHLHIHNDIQTVKLPHVSTLRFNHQGLHQILVYKTPLIIFYIVEA